MTTIIIQIIIGIVLGLLSAWLKGPTPATYEQPRRPELKARLTSRVRQAGWMLAICCLMSGCRQTAVYIPTGEPVRIAEDLNNVQVEVIGPDGTTLRRMDIPAGWYALPDDGE